MTQCLHHPLQGSIKVHKRELSLFYNSKVNDLGGIALLSLCISFLKYEKDMSLGPLS